MTSRTVTGDQRVVEVGRHPTAGRMTIGTVIGTGDVIRPFACGDIAIVATETTALHIGMIYLRCGTPAGDTVTAFTDLGRLDMSPMFTRCGGTVMATGTVAGHTCMIVGARSPGDRIMAALTTLTVSGNVCR